MVQQNTEGVKKQIQDSYTNKYKKDDKGLQKKVKLNEEEIRSAKSSNPDKENVKPVDVKMLASERDDLAEKLRFIE